MSRSSETPCPRNSPKRLKGGEIEEPAAQFSDKRAIGEPQEAVEFRKMVSAGDVIQISSVLIV